MKMVRRHDLDRVEILFLFEHLPKIGVGSAALEFVGRPVVGIVRFYDVLSYIPAARNDALRARLPIRLADGPANRVEDAVLRPVAIADRFLAGIANRNDLDIVHGEQWQQFPQALGTDPDVGQRDLVARRDHARTSQYMSRDNRERRRRSRGAQKLSSILIRSHMASLPHRHAITSISTSEFPGIPPASAIVVRAGGS